MTLDRITKIRYKYYLENDKGSKLFLHDWGDCEVEPHLKELVELFYFRKEFSSYFRIVSKRFEKNVCYCKVEVIE